MRAVTQRVSQAQVTVADETVGKIDHGLLVYLGAAKGDGPKDIEYIASKLAGLRIFADDEGRMSKSVQDVAGSVLIVSQFTLFGDTRKGRRPSFDGAAPPDQALLLVEQTVRALKAQNLPVETGRFRAHMHVTATVNGPITILLDSKKQF